MTNGYLDVFDDLLVADCPVTACFMKLYNDVSLTCEWSVNYPTTPDVTLGTTTPFGISASTANLGGYTHKFCLQCQITPTAASGLLPFNVD